MTASVSPSSSPAGYKDHVSTVTFTMSGLTASTNYWLVLNNTATATAGSQQGGGQFHASFDQECFTLAFKTDGSGAATVKWVVQSPGTWNYQVIAAPTYSSVASTTGTFTAATGG